MDKKGAISSAVGVFVFVAEDGRTPQERLKEAARVGGYGREAAGRGAGPDGSKVMRPERDIWRIARTERGKPYFPEQPELFFSISHSGSFWVCAFAGAPVGVDVQKHVKKAWESEKEAADRFERMADRFFHPREACWVKEEVYERFFRIWTAKESYVKYTGDGIGADFGKISLAPAASIFGAEGQEGVRASEDGEEIAHLNRKSFRWKAEDTWFYSKEFLEEEAGSALHGCVPVSAKYTLCVCCKEAKKTVNIYFMK
ncbi:MAG: 4'-phosphopantetheinyl transferase superfamily protein [Lachnospiraceae bacterium]|nr:4'-phosphopantetheinyl transferase superfamily protein [Lachnospiraceae bacterium]